MDLPLTRLSLPVRPDCSIWLLDIASARDAAASGVAILSDTERQRLDRSPSGRRQTPVRGQSYCTPPPFGLSHRLLSRRRPDCDIRPRQALSRRRTEHPFQSQPFRVVGGDRHCPGSMDRHRYRSGRPRPGGSQPCAHRFGSAEADYLEQCAPEIQKQAFLRHWTAKEAILKALGWGIAEHLQDFSVRVTTEEVEIYAISPPLEEALSAVRAIPLSLPETCLGAVALTAPQGNLA